MADGITLQELDSSLREQLQNTIDQVNKNLSPIPLTLNQGTNVYNVDQDSIYTDYNMKGRTLVNLLGNDGNFESTTGGFTSGGVGATLSRDSSVYKIGSWSLGLVSIAAGDSFAAKILTIDKSKNYLICGYIRNGTSANGSYMYLRNIGGTDRFSTTVTSNVWTFVYMTVSVSDFTNSTSNDLRLWMKTTSSGQTANYDGIAIHEITSTELTAISDMSSAQVEAKYPYVDNMKSIANPYVIAKGKNLLPPFSKWVLHANAVITDVYKLTLNATANDRTNSVEVSCAPNTTYTFTTTEVGNKLISPKNVNGEWTSVQGSWINTQSYQFTTPPDAYTMVVSFSNRLQGTGTFTFTNPMLNVGSVPLPFEPQNETYKFFHSTQDEDIFCLRSNVDGTIYDELINNGTQVFRRFKEYELDGSFTYAFFTDKVGHKAVKIIGQLPKAYAWHSMNVVKHNGLILRVLGTTESGGDVTGFDGINQIDLMITISDVDSGWGETYVPTPEEIKAYFNGWVMNDGANPYNGTGTKTWNKRYCGVGTPINSNMGQILVGGVTTLPTEPNDQGWTPYRVQYQLASPITVTVHSEGDIMLHKGDNQITVGTGVIVREEANPFLASGFYRVNNKPHTTSYLKYPSNDIWQVYNDSEVDARWTYEKNNNTDGNGGARATVSQISFNTESIYSVTYLPLDMYKIGIAPMSVDGSYQGNLGAVVGKLIEESVDQRRDIDVNLTYLNTSKAGKKQENWITPALLNGWIVNPPLNVSYYKDEFGIVRFRGGIKSGTTTNGTTVIIMPKGYRPKQKSAFTVSTFTGSGTERTQLISIFETGAMVIDLSASLTNIILEGISYRAE
jgi:hypothetical protein